jgi:hypothetical protein
MAWSMLIGRCYCVRTPSGHPGLVGLVGHAHHAGTRNDQESRLSASLSAGMARGAVLSPEYGAEATELGGAEERDPGAHEHDGACPQDQSFCGKGGEAERLWNPASVGGSGSQSEQVGDCTRADDCRPETANTWIARIVATL